jgi:hypothetical protein
MRLLSIDFPKKIVLKQKYSEILGLRKKENKSHHLDYQSRESFFIKNTINSNHNHHLIKSSQDIILCSANIFYHCSNQFSSKNITKKLCELKII